ncbi:MAG: hypothetical protein FJZ00_05910, partial [Candidatus Sericytochromatia bacterium]|nr:hypothetical protein [Candidatus Tanganyikabacteria bacterium]
MLRNTGVALAIACSVGACQPTRTQKSVSPAGETRPTIVFQSQQEPDALNTIISDMVASRDATTPMMS